MFKVVNKIISHIFTQFNEIQTCSKDSEMEISLENIDELISFKVIIQGQLVLNLCPYKIFDEYLKSYPNISTNFAVTKMLSLTTLKSCYNKITKENMLKKVSETFSPFKDKTFEILLNFTETDVNSFNYQLKKVLEEPNKNCEEFLIKYNILHTTEKVLNDEENVRDLQETENQRMKDLKEKTRAKSNKLLILGFKKMLEHSPNFQRTAYNLLKTDNEYDTLQTIKRLSEEK